MSETFPFSIPAGNDLVPAVSGTQNLGSLTYPFSGLYAKSIYDDGVQLFPATATSPMTVTSGVIAISTSPTFTNITASGIVTTAPSCAWIFASGITGYALSTTQYTVMSGTGFQTYSGANFTITASNPHRITYVGSSPMIGKIDVNAGSFINVNTALRVAIMKNGASGNSITPYTESRDATGQICGNVNWILPIASGDYFQVGLWGGFNIADAASSFQMAITRVI